MRTILSLAFLALVPTAFAQVNETAMKDEAVAGAKARTAQLTQELGLTEEQATRVLEIMNNTEIATLDDRMQCQKLEMRVEATLNGGYDQLTGVLTPEQEQKLQVMRKDGTISTKCCAEPAAKAGCGSSSAAPKAGCCAGKTAAAKTADPNSSLSKSPEGNHAH